MITTVNNFLSLLVVFGQILIVALVFSLVFSKSSKFLEFFRGKALFFAFIVVLASTLGSLFYSEVAGYEPCKLCWFQRIFMYPQVVLLGLALAKKDKGIGDYSLALAVPGAVIATYHYLLQIGVASPLPCSAVGYSVSCSQIFVMNLGYITIPLMALTAFSLVIVLFLNQKLSGRKD